MVVDLLLGKDLPDWVLFDWVLFYKPRDILAYILYTLCTSYYQSTNFLEPYLLSVSDFAMKKPCLQM